MSTAGKVHAEREPAPAAGVPAAKLSDAAAALTRLVHEHLDFIWRLLRRLGLSRADADDAAQQVFIVVEAKLAQIEPGKERTFLYGTALRVAANVQRNLRRHEHAHPAFDSASASGSAPDQLLEVERARALLDELLLELPLELRRVLLLAEMEGHTLAAIADLEGIPAGTAASRLRRARARFRELLERERHRNPFGGSPP